ncbi:hypothetical protein ACFO4P_04135 [Epilithonimonas pallida]|uniref:hypothetical protein n=1 Tax=Epilithonimonas pallida TaxID=373671 RepID=UPI0024B659FC|nr:hypothetical protein [Epilithonimonas pallida]
MYYWSRITNPQHRDISSSIAGGNFWQGFRQGLITSGLNHTVHMGINLFSFKGVKFVDENDKVIAKYATNKYNARIKVPYTIGGLDLNLNEMYKSLPDIDAIGVGFGGDFTFVMGGGKSIEFVFFIDGVNAGTWSTYVSQRGNLGIAGSYSVYGIAGDYFDDAKLKSSDYTGYGFSIGADIKGVDGAGASTFWAPKNYNSDKFGLKSLFDLSQRAWSGLNVSFGFGGGAQWSRINTTFYNK